MLTNFGADVPVSANGPFTFPGTLSAGQSYDVEVRTQPHNPDQVCTRAARPRDRVGARRDRHRRALRHAAACRPGSTRRSAATARVSTPVGGGHGEAVVIQPGGGIVTAGWRTTASGDGLRADAPRRGGQPRHQLRHRTGSRPPTSAAPTTRPTTPRCSPDGGIVAVGRTDAAGFTKLDFGVVRYTPDGTPDPGFGTGGIVKTDILGGGDQANAVAVQPDGKIVVAGFATRNGIDSDFALVRYNADGTLDPSFGTDGIVTTDLGTRGDDARAIAIQPDGRIVVAGTPDEDIALARYTTGGTLDATFGHGGTTITDLGSEDVANGVALTPDGHIAVAGYTLGAAHQPRLPARPLRRQRQPRHDVRRPRRGQDRRLRRRRLRREPGRRLQRPVRCSSAARPAPRSSTWRSSATAPTAPWTPSFDGDGILTADFHGRGEFGQDWRSTPSGRIVAAGYTANGSDTEFALMRANP